MLIYLFKLFNSVKLLLKKKASADYVFKSFNSVKLIDKKKLCRHF